MIITPPASIRSTAASAWARLFRENACVQAVFGVIGLRDRGEIDERDPVSCHANPPMNNAGMLKDGRDKVKIEKRTIYTNRRVLVYLCGDQAR